MEAGRRGWELTAEGRASYVCSCGELRPELFLVLPSSASAQHLDPAGLLGPPVVLAAVVLVLGGAAVLVLGGAAVLVLGGAGRYRYSQVVLVSDNHQDFARMAEQEDAHEVGHLLRLVTKVRL